MTRLVFVHGINNEENSKEAIERDWLDWLEAGYAAAREEFPVFSSVTAAFYGDVLFEATNSEPTGDAGVVEMSAGQSVQVTSDVAALYTEYQRALGITDEQVRQYGDENEVIEKGDGIHKKWLKAIARCLEDVIPTKGKYLARKFLPQAATYLERPGLKDEIDRLVEEQIFPIGARDEETYLISHSLGTIVSFSILRKLEGQLNIPRFVTLGSPLGIEIVKGRLPPPRLVPDGVGHWINGADREDFVALHPKLTAATFGNDDILNIVSFDNKEEDKHSIESYLKHGPLAVRIENPTG